MTSLKSPQTGESRLRADRSNHQPSTGCTRLEYMIHADPTGKGSLELLQRLVAVQTELGQLVGRPQGPRAAEPSLEQLNALKTAVQVGQDVIRLLWQHQHGRSLPDGRASAGSEASRLVRVVA